MIHGSLVLVLTSFGIGAASALIWVLNVETYVLAVCATAARGTAIASVVAMTIGVTLGKVVLYLIARHGPDAVRRWRRYRGATDVAEASLADQQDDASRPPAHVTSPSGAAPPDATTEGVPLPGSSSPPAPGERSRQAWPTPVGGTADPPKRRRWAWTYAWVPEWAMVRLRAIGAWGTRLLRTLDQPGRAFIVVFASATLGVPPLAATTIAAGLRRTSIPAFVLGVLPGRTVRFSILAVPALLAVR